MGVLSARRGCISTPSHAVRLTHRPPVCHGAAVPDLITLRTARPSDMHFVIDSWVRSNRNGSPEGRAVMSDDDYYSYTRDLVSRILARSKVTVAVLATSPDVLAGWICTEDTPIGEVLHYAVVKANFWRCGLLWQMLGGRPKSLIISHRTGYFEPIFRSAGITVRFLPWLREKEAQHVRTTHSAERRVSYSDTSAARNLRETSAP